MMPNFLVVFAASIIPLIIGFIYYHPKTLGGPWMKEIGVTPENMDNSKMGLIFGVTFVFSFLLAFAMPQMVIHQSAIASVLANKMNIADHKAYYDNFLSVYGQEFRTFKHGAFHGVIYSIFVALPVLGINALFERKSFKYIFIHLGYWLITMAIMGGIICQWA